MPNVINVAILEDHQSTIDGYQLRLSEHPGTQVIANCLFSEGLDDMLENNPVDVLILDINVPISKENRNIQPIHQLIIDLKNKFPELTILVISMHAQRTMIKTILEAGTSEFRKNCGNPGGWGNLHE